MSSFHGQSVAALAVILLGVPAGVVSQRQIHISGYGNTHFMDHGGTAALAGRPPLDNGFLELREFSLFVDVAITDRIVASTEIEAGNNGTRYTANYAFVDVQIHERLSVRLGKILVPFLSYNENKPNFRQHLMSQPFTAWNVAPVVGTAIQSYGFGWSDAGAVANVSTPVGSFGLVDLKLAVINGLGSRSSVLDDNFIRLDDGAMRPTVRPRDGLLQNEPSDGLADNNRDKASVVKWSFRLSAVPVEVGASWYRGKWDPAGTQNLQMVGGHLNWLEPRWTLKGEWVRAQVDQVAGTDPVAAAGLMGPAMLNTSTGDYQMEAWYVEGSVVPWVSGTRWARLIGRVDGVDTNDQIPFTPFDRTRLTGGVEWQVGQGVRARYEYQRATLDDFGMAPGPYRNAGGAEHVTMHMASFIFAF